MIWWALIAGPWLVFCAWWLVRSVGTAHAVEREPRGARLLHLALVGGGALLLAGAVPLPSLRRQLWAPSSSLAAVAAVLSVGGVAFAIWAREHLGRYWSSAITLKEGHRIVRTGPYRLARHPIYTGMLTGLLGPVLVRGDLAGLCGFALMAAGITRKLLREERLLERHFADEYRDYRRQVRALIPFIL